MVGTPRPPGEEKGAEHPAAAGGLGQPARGAIRNPPWAEGVGARGPAVRGRAAELADHERERVRDARDRDRDVVEQDASHEPAVDLSARRGTAREFRRPARPLTGPAASPTPSRPPTRPAPTRAGA